MIYFYFLKQKQNNDNNIPSINIEIKDWSKDNNNSISDSNDNLIYLIVYLIIIKIYFQL